MIVKPARFDSFLRTLDPPLRAALVYGPDRGMVRERADTLLRAVVEDPADPFRVVTLTGADIAGDPARLADEAAALSLTGGRRVVRLNDAADGVADALAAILDDAPGDALIIVEAGALAPRSALRKLFEKAKTGAAIPCYADDRESIAGLVREMLAPHGLAASRDALAYLVDNLGGDRALSRRELEKLVLYMGSADSAGAEERREVSLEDAAACVGDSAALGLDDAAFATADGDFAALDRITSRLFLEGVAPVSVLRAAGRHFQRLHLVAGRVAAGAGAEQAMAGLRPPVFFKLKDRFRSQLRYWPTGALAKALERLTEAEIQCKSTGLPDRAICSRALMALANAAARRRAR